MTVQWLYGGWWTILQVVSFPPHPTLSSDRKQISNSIFSESRLRVSHQNCVCVTISGRRGVHSMVSSFGSLLWRIGSQPCRVLRFTPTVSSSRNQNKISHPPLRVCRRVTTPPGGRDHNISDRTSNGTKVPNWRCPTCHLSKIGMTAQTEAQVTRIERTCHAIVTVTPVMVVVVVVGVMVTPVMSTTLPHTTVLSHGK